MNHVHQCCIQMRIFIKERGCHFARTRISQNILILLNEGFVFLENTLITHFIDLKQQKPQ